MGVVGYGSRTLQNLCIRVHDCTMHTTGRIHEIVHLRNPTKRVETCEIV